MRDEYMQVLDPRSTTQSDTIQQHNETLVERELGSELQFSDDRGNVGATTRPPGAGPNPCSKPGKTGFEPGTSEAN